MAVAPVDKSDTVWHFTNGRVKPKGVPCYTAIAWYESRVCRSTPLSEGCNTSTFITVPGSNYAFLCLLPNWKLCNNLDKKSQFIPVRRGNICAIPPWGSATSILVWNDLKQLCTGGWWLWCFEQQHNQKYAHPSSTWLRISKCNIPNRKHMQTECLTSHEHRLTITTTCFPWR